MIDFHGNAMTQHVANRAWDAAKWVAGLRKASRLSSREIYWKVWGLTHFLTCGECGEQFPVCELDHCAHHPRPPHFESGENSGHYPCCGLASLRFDPSAGQAVEPRAGALGPEGDVPRPPPHHARHAQRRRLGALAADDRRRRLGAARPPLLSESHFLRPKSGYLSSSHGSAPEDLRVTRFCSSDCRIHSLRT